MRCEKRQKLANNRSPLCRGIGRRCKQFIEAICHDDEVIGSALRNLLAEIAFERMFQIAPKAPKACAGYSNLLTIGIPQILCLLQWRW